MRDWILRLGCFTSPLKKVPIFGLIYLNSCSAPFTFSRLFLGCFRLFPSSPVVLALPLKAFTPTTTVVGGSADSPVRVNRHLYRPIPLALAAPIPTRLPPVTRSLLARHAIAKQRRVAPSRSDGGPPATCLPRQSGLPPRRETQTGVAAGHLAPDTFFVIPQFYHTPPTL